MIRLTQQELDYMVLLDKQILVDCPAMNEHVTIAGTQLWFDTSFEPTLHMATHGKVVKEPIEPITVRLDDEVFFHFLEIQGCIDDGKNYNTTDTNVRYWQTNEEKLYMYVRDGVMTMLNDWVLVEAIPIEAEYGQNGLLLNPVEVQNKAHLPNEGTVRAVPNSCPVNIGDRVVFKTHFDVPMEFSDHESLKKKYFRVKQDAILTTIE